MLEDSQQNKILVFIPCYNCENQIPRVLEQFRDLAVSKWFNTILVLDNGSRDNTCSVAQQKALDLPHLNIIVGKNNDNYGLGGSHKSAFSFAIEGDFTHVVVLHGDDQGAISDLIPELISMRFNEYDCCLGARFHPNSSTHGYSRFRILGNHVFNMIFSLSSFNRVYDLGAGLNIYKTSMLKTNFYHQYSDDLRFNCYMLLGTFSQKLKVHFFPITWREDDQISNVKLFSQSINTLKIALGFMFFGEKYLAREHRIKNHKQYKFTKFYKG